MQKKYLLEVNETQLRFIKDACEEYMRLRMNQWEDFADDIALQNALAPSDDEYFIRNDYKRSLEQLTKQVLENRRQFGGYPEKNETMKIAEDIYEVIRHELWKRYGKGSLVVDARPPLKWSQEPLPLISEKQG